MTRFEAYFIEVMEWYAQRKIDVFINGSTLLNIIRRHTVNPRKGVRDDKEINLAILEEDFCEDWPKELLHANKMVRRVENTSGKFFDVYYAKEDTQFPTDSMWSLKPGFVYLTVIRKGPNGVRFKQHEGDHCIRVTKECVEDKTKWVDLKVLGHVYRGPAYVGRFLDDYYGRWWEEDLGWHWMNSPIHFNYQDLLKGEIC